MNGANAVFCTEVVGEHMPEVVVTIAPFHSNACTAGTLDTTTADALPAKVRTEEDVGGVVASNDTGLALVVEGIEVFFSREAVINPGDGFVDDASDALSAEQRIHLAKERHRVSDGQPRAHQQSAIGQAAVRAECVAVEMGGQHCQQGLAAVEQQGVIAEAVGMIVHVPAVKEECAVLRFSDKSVPFAGPISRIFHDLHYCSNKLFTFHNYLFL